MVNFCDNRLGRPVNTNFFELNIEKKPLRFGTVLLNIQLNVYFSVCIKQ